MNLVQFNLDVDPKVKKKVRKDSVGLEFVHAVIANAIFTDFFKRYPRQSDRREIYEKMKHELNGSASANGSHVEQTTAE